MIRGQRVEIQVFMSVGKLRAWEPVTFMAEACQLTAKPEQNWIEGRLYGQAWQKTL